MRKLAWIIASLFVGCSPVTADELDTFQTVNVSGFCDIEEDTANLANAFLHNGLPALEDFIADPTTGCYSAELGSMGSMFEGMIVQKTLEVPRIEDGYTMEVYLFFAPWIKETQMGWTWVFAKIPGEML